jgi:hypothetical protein
VIAFEAITAVVSGTSVAVWGPPTNLLPFRWVLEEALAYALANVGRYMLHCAAVADSQSARLVLGESGAGKSTLCWTATQAGFDVLGDDYVIVHAVDGAVRASGYPKRLVIPDDVVSPPPEGAERVERNGRVRWVMPPRLTTPAQRDLDGLIFPTKGATRAATPRSGRDVLVQVLDAHPPSRSPAYLQRFFSTAAAIARLPSDEVRLHPDPEQRVSHLAAELRDVLARG